ncbi:hypothetical protein [Mesorhizobium sanjuanii]|uniref:hypothetical protein n=1 Tax=Mesorhizobium sanjuanii TaxID=2037900 RepID=UPI001055D5B6|nr:hypothetical protein [Mesorhizobium sanjuanii]
MGGYRGHDAFVFKTNFGTGHTDRNIESNKSQDKIDLDHSALAGPKPAGLSHAFSGHDSSDRVIHNSLTGALSFDDDEHGGASQAQFATHFPWQHHSL